MLLLKKKQQHNGWKKHIQIKQWPKEKESLGDVKFLKELETSAEDELCNFLRMDKECSCELLSKVLPYNSQEKKKHYERPNFTTLTFSYYFEVML